MHDGPATQEVKTGGLQVDLQVQGEPGQFSECLFQKKKKGKKTGLCVCRGRAFV